MTLERRTRHRALEEMHGPHPVPDNEPRPAAVTPAFTHQFARLEPEPASPIVASPFAAFALSDPHRSPSPPAVIQRQALHSPLDEEAPAPASSSPAPEAEVAAETPAAEQAEAESAGQHDPSAGQIASDASAGSADEGASGADDAPPSSEAETAQTQSAAPDEQLSREDEAGVLEALQEAQPEAEPDAVNLETAPSDPAIGAAQTAEPVLEADAAPSNSDAPQTAADAASESSDADAQTADSSGAAEPEETLSLQAQSLGNPIPRWSEDHHTLHSDLSTALRGGDPLHGELRGELEAYHQARLDSVRVHVNPDLTARVNARAFTTGNNIVFGSHADLHDRALVAHETAHVKQQAQGSVLGSSIALGVRLSDPGDADERAASEAGARFARGETQTASSTPSSPAATQSPAVSSSSASSSDPGVSIQRSWWGDAASWVSDKASGAWNGMKQFAAQGWGWVKDKASAALVAALEKAGQAFGGTGSRIVEMLKGIGSGVLSILQNPGTFVGNLISGVKTGFLNFATNAKSHLGGILGSWLTGNTGVTLPSRFEPLEILKSVLSTVGASWGNLRGKITSRLGTGSARALALAEKSVPLVQNLSKGQFHNLEDIKSQVLPAVQTEAVDGLKTGVRDTVLKQGAIALLSRLNPAGGIVTIFKTVQFLVEKASAIGSFVSSVWGSISDVARGNVGGAAAKVESSLVSGISLALNFLSKQIGLDGIVTKVRSVISSISAKVNRALDFVAAKATKLVQPIFEKLKSGAARVTSAVSSGVDKAKQKGGELLERGKQFINGIFGKKTFQAGGEQHSVWVKIEQNKPELWIASTPREAGQQLAAIRAEAEQKGLFSTIEPSWNQARTAIQTARGKLQAVRSDLTLPDDKRREKQNEAQKRMTDITNGVIYSVRDVLEQLHRSGGNEADLRVNLDAKLVRGEMWASGRPGWAKKTLDALIRDYPWAFDANGNVKTDAYNKPMYDRRHIVAFDKIIDTEVGQLNGKSYTQAGNYLRGKSAKLAPKANNVNGKVDISSVKTSLKTHLAIEFNDVTNLWVGDAAENQRIGREFAAAQARRKNLQPGTPEFEAESQKVATNQVDVEKGSTTGRNLTVSEQNAIQVIQDANVEMRRFIAKRNELKLMFSNLMTRDTDFSDAIETRDNLVNSMEILRKASRVAINSNGNQTRSANNLSIDSANQVKRYLDMAVKNETILNEILRKD